MESFILFCPGSSSLFFLISFNFISLPQWFHVLVHILSFQILLWLLIVSRGGVSRPQTQTTKCVEKRKLFIKNKKKKRGTFKNQNKMGDSVQKRETEARRLFYSDMDKQDKTDMTTKEKQPWRDIRQPSRNNDRTQTKGRQGLLIQEGRGTIKGRTEKET